jgi:hypothetical protein
MGELVDELESLGYDNPTLVTAAPSTLSWPGGQACVEAGRATMKDLEDEITRRLGQRGHHQLRRMLQELLDVE